MFDRVIAPVGVAPVAAHVDQYGGPEQAACDDVREEMGVTVTHFRLLLDQWRPARCCHTPADPVSHHLWIFQAEVSGSLRPSPGEARDPRWVHPDQLQEHALPSASYADGHPKTGGVRARARPRASVVPFPARPRPDQRSLTGAPGRGCRLPGGC
ncbi:NUDIX domain-containing protein [Streptomyces sp. NPDC006739]|uniref:NUDIX domain-containing protein n=1 Tax=Streptomyces sp. NPDC006739 TaxID=3364763 RepID=UPI0036C1FDA9